MGTHICYGCHLIFSLDKLAYECMCFHMDDTYKYRGLCSDCAIIPINKWVEIPAKSHNLLKIHKLSEVAKEAYEQIKQLGLSYTVSIKDNIFRYESNKKVILFPRDYVKCDCC